MPVQITITNVPEEVRDKLAKRAALHSQSLEEFLRCEMARMVAPSPNAEILRKARKRLEDSQSRVPAWKILRAIDADRM